MFNKFRLHQLACRNKLTLLIQIKPTRIIEQINTLRFPLDENESPAMGRPQNSTKLTNYLIIGKATTCSFDLMHH